MDHNEFKATAVAHADATRKHNHVSETHHGLQSGRIKLKDALNQLKTYPDFQGKTKEHVAKYYDQSKSELSAHAEKMAKANDWARTLPKQHSEYSPAQAHCADVGTYTPAVPMRGVEESDLEGEQFAEIPVGTEVTTDEMDPHPQKGLRKLSRKGKVVKHVKDGLGLAHRVKFEDGKEEDFHHSELKPVAQHSEDSEQFEEGNHPDNSKPEKKYGNRQAHRQPNGKLRWYRYDTSGRNRWVRTAGPEHHAHEEDSAQHTEEDSEQFAESIAGVVRHHGFVSGHGLNMFKHAKLKGNLSVRGSRWEHFDGAKRLGSGTGASGLHSYLKGLG